MKTFKQKVYNVVRKIPRGSFLTYKEVAKKAGNPKAYRAVGNILNKSSGLPCHRVVRKDGLTGGYNKGKAKKISLLKKEGVLIKVSGIVH